MGRVAMLTLATPDRSVAPPAATGLAGERHQGFWCALAVQRRPHRQLFLLNVLHGPFLMFLQLIYTLSDEIRLSDDYGAWNMFVPGLDN